MKFPPGKRIKKILKDKKITQQELGLKLNISSKTVREIIHGRQPITIKNALKLEREFNIPAEKWLMEDMEYQLFLLRNDGIPIKRYFKSGGIKKHENR